MNPEEFENWLDDELLRTENWSLLTHDHGLGVTHSPFLTKVEHKSGIFFVYPIKSPERGKVLKIYSPDGFEITTRTVRELKPLWVDITEREKSWKRTANAIARDNFLKDFQG